MTGKLRKIDSLDELSEWMKPRAELLIAILQALGINVTVYSTGRTIAEQLEKIRLGHSKVKKSKHLIDFDRSDAIDLVLDPPFTYRLAGHIWTLLGGKWGGDFKDPQLAAVEFQHFEKP